MLNEFHAESDKKIAGWLVAIVRVKTAMTTTIILEELTKSNLPACYVIFGNRRYCGKPPQNFGIKESA